MTAENPNLPDLDFDKLLEVASASGRYSREELENLYAWRDRKNDPAQIDAEPPLLSDQLVTFAADVPARALTVQLKILGWDYYEYLLPRLTEIVFALYGEQAISMLETLRPQQLLMKVVALALDRPKRDRVKLSLLETLSHTFSTETVTITPGFLYILPPDEILEAVGRLVELNERNFIRFWGRVPLHWKNQATLLYLRSIEVIESLNQRLMGYILSLKTAIPSFPSDSGGVSDTGTAGSSEPASSATKPAKAIRPSRAKPLPKSG